jgi:hypothetical protein
MLGDLLARCKLDRVAYACAGWYRGNAESLFLLVRWSLGEGPGGCVLCFFFCSRGSRSC